MWLEKIHSADAVLKTSCSSLRMFAHNPANVRHYTGHCRARFFSLPVGSEVWCVSQAREGLRALRDVHLLTLVRWNSLLCAVNCISMCIFSCSFYGLWACWKMSMVMWKVAENQSETSLDGTGTTCFSTGNLKLQLQFLEYLRIISQPSNSTE